MTDFPAHSSRPSASRRLPAIVPLLFALAGATACGEVGTVDMLLDLTPFGSPTLGAVRAPRVELTITDANGQPVTAFVDADGSAFEVTSPIPVGCSDNDCAVQLRLRPGSYDFSLQVYAQDHCGAEAQLLELQTAGLIDVGPGVANAIEFTRQSFAFDNDGDGIDNAFEVQTCGRFDRPDDDRRWTDCSEETDACCDPTIDPRIGGLVEFEPLTYLGPAAEEVFVDRIFVDATEATMGTLRRCVAARACLADQPNHPVWTFIEDVAVFDDEPIRGLDPAEAQAVCEWVGKRLPTALERDRIAAGRPDGTRVRFPWGNLNAVGCQPDGADTFAANHRALNQACPGVPLPVGLFPTVDVDGEAMVGVDAPPFVADLAGNVAEWTVDFEPGAVVADLEEVSSGASLVTHAGGGYNSLPFLLENDEQVDIVVPTPDDIDGIENFKSTIARFAPITGFRCVTTEIPELSPRTCAE